MGSVPLVTNNRKPLFRSSSTGRFLGYKTRFAVDTLSSGIANFEFKTREVMEERAVEFAEELVKYAKENAPWGDRTGFARSGLSGQVDSDGQNLTVSLFHTAPHGVWLEVRWNGRYAIILPTIEKKGSELLERWDDIMSDTYYPD